MRGAVLPPVSSMDAPAGGPLQARATATWTAATTAAIERVAAKEPEPDARRLFGHKLTETGAWTAHPHVAEGAQAPGDKVVTVRVGCLSPAQVVFPFHTMCTGAMERATDGNGGLRPGPGPVLLLCEGIGSDKREDFPHGLTFQSAGLWPTLHKIFADVEGIPSKNVVSVLLRKRCAFGASRARDKPFATGRGPACAGA